ncbi:hypothetical protein GMOD_00006501 [Pyrenophora seminiperda CCB06]|uniref:Uncharacterized protein n=1 Tax=Pyrenophora seminiperda CCB06 TaxID=1302712 RepID=A0A3M7MAM0_9PLEO|nr:hypothetical protein GMOD_00006501 [Pyrenophora seminiperda CCB06]
MGSSLDATTS